VNKPTQIIRGKGADGKDLSEAEILSFNASSILGRLFELAESGNADAIKQLHSVTVCCVSELTELCQHLPEMFQAIAIKTSVWPGWLSCDADIKKSSEKLVGDLQLGSEAGLKYSGKPWTRETTGTDVALKLYSILKPSWEDWQRKDEIAKQIRDRWTRMNKRFGRPTNFRPAMKPIKMDAKTKAEFALYRQSKKLVQKLNPLSRANYKQWWNAAKPTFIARYGSEFQDNKIFADFWRDAEKWSVREKKKPKGIVRREILKSIERGFKSIAP
jgi:hypothetical protein